MNSKSLIWEWREGNLVLLSGIIIALSYIQTSRIYCTLCLKQVVMRYPQIKSMYCIHLPYLECQRNLNIYKKKGI